MGRVKDLLLKQQKENGQPNPNDIKLFFNDQWFLLATMGYFIKHSKYSTNRKNRLIKLLNIFLAASNKGSSIKFNKMLANTKK